MSEAQIVQTIPDVAPWLLRDALFVCVACGQWSDRGFLGTVVPEEDAPYICRECAEDLVTAYVASAPDVRLIRVQTIEMPLAPAAIATGDVTVSATFDPAGDPRSVEVEISPEAASATAELDLIEATAVRLCEYLSSYRGAGADDQPMEG